MASKLEGEWKEWGNHILAELDRLNMSVETLKSDINDIKLEIAKQKIKTGTMSTMYGVIGSAVMLGVAFIFGKL